MGSKSRSNSSQQTSNTSTSLGVQGDNQGFMNVGDGNSYNITTTDGGLVDGLVSIWGDMAGNQSEMTTTVGSMATDAFDYGRDVNRDSLDAMQDTTLNTVGEMGNALKNAFEFGGGIAHDSIAAQSNLARDSIAAQNYLAESTVKENSDLARGVAQLAESMHGNNTAFANNAIEANAAVVRDSNNNMADLAYYTADNASNLARDFAGSFADVTGGLAVNVIEATNNAYKDASDQTILAHKQALQFADNASRSDGQQLAISTNETMKYIVIGLGGIAIVAMFWGRK